MQHAKHVPASGLLHGHSLCPQCPSPRHPRGSHASLTHRLVVRPFLTPEFKTANSSHFLSLFSALYFPHCVHCFLTHSTVPPPNRKEDPPWQGSVLCSLMDIQNSAGHIVGIDTMCGRKSTPGYSRKKSLHLSAEIFKNLPPVGVSILFFPLRQCREETCTIRSQLRPHPQINGLLLTRAVVLIFLRCSVH